MEAFEYVAITTSLARKLSRAKKKRSCQSFEEQRFRLPSLLLMNQERYLMKGGRSSRVGTVCPQ